MRWYADAPVRRSRQVLADLLVLAWVVAWVLVGRWVHALVMTLAAPAGPLRDAGTSLRDRMTEAADRVVEVPVVGGSLGSPFTGAAGVGTDLVAAGERLEASVRTVALVVSLVSVATPVLLVLLLWGVVRLSWSRRAAALGRDLDDPRTQELLALRALVRESPRRLRQVHPDPVEGWRSGDRAVVRALADLELAQVGLRSRPPSR
ncbi:hypothetical protein [Ornithinimicrobium pekingense]|uniref:Uncharacterized protein n=1 Tax=Ornithinimicrobium pekingense TaxID=384677 RepID=A0ABQ2F9Z6_9MICO|nr:hypothetical protein [Ornithinimicrobium pekingense]GGK76222.1 hypothetical protein GCM10011509_26010 [Ornithinimicrobium pekingense]